MKGRFVTSHMYGPCRRADKVKIPLLCDFHEPAQRRGSPEGRDGRWSDLGPAFFTRKSGFGVDFRAESAAELAEMLKTKWSIPLRGGVIIANPVPHEFESDAKVIDKAIKKALDYAREQGIKGKAITPFLLGEIERRTEGASLKTNIQLVLNNAALAARIAKAYCAMD